MNAISNFIDEAMSRAQCEWLDEENGFYADIPNVLGVWATGYTVADCMRELHEVLEDWIALGVKLGHPLPDAFDRPPS
jgi:predicted RNase H-like HicB family nuclease